MKRKVILASASPRRLEIMNKHGVEPLVMPTDADETITGDPSMTEVVEDLSRRKALACYNSIKEDNRYAGYMIVAADTIVYKDGILGKPVDAEDARRMLRSYRGTYHYVVTMLPGYGAKTILMRISRITYQDQNHTIKQAHTLFRDTSADT